MIPPQTQLHYCPNRGCLAACADWVPDHFADHNFHEQFPSIGCNRIVCDRCGQLVKQRRRYKCDVKYDQERACAAALYDTEDWSGFSFVQHLDGDWMRLYYCACSLSNNQWTTALDGRDDHLIYGASYPLTWHCNGHPPFTLPTEIYGVSLKKLRDVAKVIAAVMEHRAIIQDPIRSDEVNPEAFLINRLYALLDTEDCKSPIDKLMTQFLRHPDALYRSVACIHLEKFPDSKAAAKLVGVLRTNPELYAGVLHPQYALATNPEKNWQLIGLDHQIQLALLAYFKVSQSKAAQKLLRKLILAGQMKAHWHQYEAEIGTDWLEANLKKIYTANPQIALFSLLAGTNDDNQSMKLERAKKLQAMQIMPDEEFLDHLPYPLDRAMKPPTSDKSKKRRK